MNEAAKDYEWAIRAGSHIYVTLYYFGKIVRCFDNDMEDGAEIITAIEKKTRKKITDLPLVECTENDFSGFRFIGKGFLNLLSEAKQRGK